jgi:Holliday junction resolvase
MGKFSRSKGARGERLLCSALRDHGYDAHRTAQRAGKLGNAPDVDGLPGIHAECKFVERLNVRDAMEQAKRDAAASGGKDLPAVFHKRSNESWLVTMELDDWIQIYREWEGGVNRD